MEYPQPGAMQLLFAIYDGHEMVVRENDLWLCVPPDESRLFESEFDTPATMNAVPTYLVPEEATDALFDRGWIEWSDETGKPFITDGGRYHLERWLRGWLADAERAITAGPAGRQAGVLRWLKRASLPEMRARYRIKTPEEWGQKAEAAK